MPLALKSNPPSSFWSTGFAASVTSSMSSSEVVTATGDAASVSAGWALASALVRFAGGNFLSLSAAACFSAISMSSWIFEAISAMASTVDTPGGQVTSVKASCSGASSLSSWTPMSFSSSS